MKKEFPIFLFSLILTLMLTGCIQKGERGNISKTAAISYAPYPSFYAEIVLPPIKSIAVNEKLPVKLSIYNQGEEDMLIRWVRVEGSTSGLAIYPSPKIEINKKVKPGRFLRTYFNITPYITPWEQVSKTLYFSVCYDYKSIIEIQDIYLTTSEESYLEKKDLKLKSPKSKSPVVIEVEEFKNGITIPLKSAYLLKRKGNYYEVDLDLSIRIRNLGKGKVFKECKNLQKGLKSLILEFWFPPEVDVSIPVDENPDIEQGGVSIEEEEAYKKVRIEIKKTSLEYLSSLDEINPIIHLKIKTKEEFEGAFTIRAETSFSYRDIMKDASFTLTITER